MNIWETCKEKESIEILKFLGLFKNIEEHNKIYNYVWIKHKSSI